LSSVPLTQAVTSGDAGQVKALLANGADANERTGGGQTPLILATIFGHTHLIPLLLDAGADPQLRDNLGLNTVDWAQRRGATEVLEVLSNKGNRTARTETRAQTPPPRSTTTSSEPGIDKSGAVSEAERSRRWIAGLKQRIAEQSQRELPDGPNIFRQPRALDSQPDRSTAFPPNPTLDSQPDRSTVLPSKPTFEPRADESNDFLQQRTLESLSLFVAADREPEPEIPATPPPEPEIAPTPAPQPEIPAPSPDPQPDMPREPAQPESPAEPEPPAQTESPAHAKLAQSGLAQTESAQPASSAAPSQPKSQAPTLVAEAAQEPARRSGRKRCPKCNAIYNSDLVFYCAHHIVPLVDDDELPPIISEPHTTSPVLFWMIIVITLTGSLVFGSVIAAFVYSSKQVHPVITASPPTSSAVQKGTPVVGEELEGKVTSLPVAECPLNGQEAIPGTVVVQVTVDKTGQVIEARASGGDWLLRGAATEAAMKSTFAPEKLRGRDTEGTITYTFEP
jgi:hypothetical protein